MTNGKTRLLLVYNADSGIMNALKDTVWKLVSPQTYPCSLCAITHGAFSMHDEWRRFLERLPMEVAFYHRDEFAQAYTGHAATFPAIMPAILIASRDDSLRILISKDELDSIESTHELMDHVEQRLIDDQMRRPRLKIVA